MSWPYDYIIMALAFEVASFVLWLLWRGGRHLWLRRRARGLT